VDIRLHGDFERTTLHLRHTGFVSSFDVAWHRALWDLSIGRLVSLYGTQDRLQSFGERPKELRQRLERAILE
jgi:hypothetical protein